MEKYYLTYVFKIDRGQAVPNSRNVVNKDTGTAIKSKCKLEDDKYSVVTKVRMFE